MASTAHRPGVAVADGEMEVRNTIRAPGIAKKLVLLDLLVRAHAADTIAVASQRDLILA